MVAAHADDVDRVAHKATSIRAAVMGLGYAWYPEDAIREELERGAPKPLPLREGAEEEVARACRSEAAQRST